MTRNPSDTMILVTKCAKMSEKGRAVILYDNTCELCVSSTKFASKLLRKKKIDSQLVGIAASLKRELNPNDEFMFFYEGERYQSHFAWVKIFSLSPFPFNLIKYFEKYPWFVRKIEKFYRWVSKNRKKWFKKKNPDCNC